MLAAAIKANANIIVTNNLKDFPKEYLSSFGLTAKSADEFLTEVVDRNNSLALEAFKTLVLNRISPYLDEFEVLDRLRRVGLNNSADYLDTLL